MSPVAPDQDINRSVVSGDSPAVTNQGAVTSAKNGGPRFAALLRTTPAFPLLALPIGLAFLALSSLPLWHTDLWGHLAYGRFIWQAGSIPATEPFMPLSRGVELVDTAWLSQVIGFLA